MNLKELTPMYCQQRLSYVVRQGDSLYQLARFYGTTVPSILALNPNIDPYNLQAGSTIIICPGENDTMQPNNMSPPARPNPSSQISLINDMRTVWFQHVYWARMLLISIAERLRDQNAVTNRLLQNPNDIANIFRRYYSADTADNIARLLTEHLQIGSALITALRDGKRAEADVLTRQWYINADKIADALSMINPHYDYEDLRKMLYRHLELTTQEVAMRLAGNYMADIEAFNQVEQQAISMADLFSAGIIRQFPQNFHSAEQNW